MSIECYTDASYNPKNKIAIIGYKIGSDQIRLHRINDTNNTRAEIIGLLILLDHLDLDKSYVVYTDLSICYQ